LERKKKVEKFGGVFNECGNCINIMRSGIYGVYETYIDGLVA